MSNAEWYLPHPCGRGPRGSNSLLAVAANWSWSWAGERMWHTLIKFHIKLLKVNLMWAHLSRDVKCVILEKKWLGHWFLQWDTLKNPAGLFSGVNLDKHSTDLWQIFKLWFMNSELNKPSCSHPINESLVKLLHSSLQLAALVLPLLIVTHWLLCGTLPRSSSGYVVDIVHPAHRVHPALPPIQTAEWKEGSAQLTV